MSEKILLVDDEENILLGYKRALRKDFDLDTANGGAVALKMVEENGPYAVVVSDMRMPEMNGVELLSTLKVRAPDTVRMMLTGNSDQQTAIDAINKGDIFRFLNKPCGRDAFCAALAAGIKQSRLITAEKELLQKTLAGSIRMLAEVLSLTDPVSFGRTARLQRIARGIVTELGINRDWWLEPAVLLSQIGCITLPEQVSNKVADGHGLDADEYRLFARHPSVGADLLEKIPRMDEVAACIRYQEKNFDGTGVPHDGVAGKDIPLGARILKAALDYDRSDAAGLAPAQTLEKLKENAGWYDPEVLEALTRAQSGGTPLTSRRVHILDLDEGMTLAEDVRTDCGILLVARGLNMTFSVIQRLDNYHRKGVIPAAVKIVDEAESPHRR